MTSGPHRLAAKDTALSRRRHRFKSGWGYQCGDVAQLGERLNGIQEARGSIPLISTIIVAGWSSLVARRAHNPEVVGSNPAPATNFGGVAQLVRAHGSYPCCHWFKSSRRYHVPH